ncbi:hypothetical protein [Arsenophonus endosymbiont of Aleurodicus floccissimus]|uniref:hypothetical protein n=1 Tax=Arsenophonus endosymbiont of Aleurodicus floccissimus TaxID=2152761 RepID=UPI001EDDE87A|nr:hypothetical protein [Arsenophonus endosymbiont of Aleurodicus floccissimus]
MIAHSQGALYARYVATNYPAIIASVTIMNGVNYGSELADLLRKILLPGMLTERLVTVNAEVFLNLFLFFHRVH